VIRVEINGPKPEGFPGLGPKTASIIWCEQYYQSRLARNCPSELAASSAYAGGAEQNDKLFVLRESHVIQLLKLHTDIGQHLLGRADFRGLGVALVLQIADKFPLQGIFALEVFGEHKIPPSSTMKCLVSAMVLQSVIVFFQ